MAGDPTIEADWALHPQFAQDCFDLGDLALCRLLLMDDATYPWLILVPRRAGASEIVDLEPPERTVLMVEIAAVSAALRGITGCDKLNVAALGNAVAQLHVHVIARFRTDPAWPRPVWGVVAASPYVVEARTKLASEVRQALQL